MQVTVDDLLSQIEKLQLMPAKDLEAMEGRWFRPGRQEVNDATRFCDWLRVNDYMTEFVISVLARGKADWLVWNQYRLTDQLRTGAQAGDYLATDPLDRVLRPQIGSPSAHQGPAWYEQFRPLAQRLTNVPDPVEAPPCRRMIFFFSGRFFIAPSRARNQESGVRKQESGGEGSRPCANRSRKFRACWPTCWIPWSIRSLPIVRRAPPLSPNLCVSCSRPKRKQAWRAWKKK